MPKYGEAIFERRDLLGITGPEAATFSEQYAREDPALYAKFSQQTLSRWESDRTGAIIAASSPARIRALARALRWTVGEFEERVGVPTFGATPAPNGPGRIEIAGGLVLVPVVGWANGGKPDSLGGILVDPEFVRGGNTRAFRVVGNSMDNGSDKAIKDGNWVLVDTSLTEPIPGRVFLLEVIGDGMTVKRLRKIDGEWRFASDNPEVDEAWRDDQVDIIGEVYGRVNFDEVR